MRVELVQQLLPDTRGELECHEHSPRVEPELTGAKQHRADLREVVRVGASP